MLVEGIGQTLTVIVFFIPKKLYFYVGQNKHREIDDVKLVFKNNYNLLSITITLTL